MKKYLLLLVFAYSASFVMAQNIEADPLLVTVFEASYLGNGGDRAGHSTMTNTATTEKTFTWVLDTICNPADIEIVYCDKVACYLTDVEGTITLEAGESSTMDLHVVESFDIPNPVIATVTITEVGNADNTVTVTYEYGACDTPISEIPTGLEEIEAAKSITLYPNPAHEAFMLTANTVVENVVVYNILGGVVKRFNASSNNTYYIADLNSGIYMVQLLGEKDELLRTMKMNKQ